MLSLRLLAATALSFGLAGEPAAATIPAPTPHPNAVPQVCPVELDVLVALDSNAAGAARSYVMSLGLLSNESISASGTIALYDAANRWDLPFKSALAAQQNDAAHQPTPIVVRFPEPVRLDVGRLASLDGPAGGSCTSVSARALTNLNEDEVFARQLVARARSVAPVDAPVPVRDPAPACEDPNVQADTANAVQPVTTDLMRKEGASVALVKVSIADDGTVVGAVLYKSSGSAAGDTSALQSARASTFAPGASDCRSFGGIYIFRVDFQHA